MSTSSANACFSDPKCHLPPIALVLRAMPEISRFFGIVVRMYHHDHAPPHFHARYGEFVVAVQLDTWTIHGRFPPRARRLVLEWAELHRNELLEDWELARSERPLRPIPPLE